MANKNYIGFEYFCSVCKTFFTATEDLLGEVGLINQDGESLDLTTIECSHCKSISLPEGMNQIAWLREEMEKRA